MASVMKSATWFEYQATPPATLLAGRKTVVRVRDRGMEETKSSVSPLRLP
jgi:hypothetical protein